MPGPTKYEQIIERIFFDRFDGAANGFEFPRSALNDAADALNLSRVSNVADVLYTFRSRKELPGSIRETAEPGREWIIGTTATGQYRFDQVENVSFNVSRQLAAISIPDSTPALIQLYRQSDEQALLAILRYNRLIDIFTHLSCFSVQSHLRTSLPGAGQIEVDELYVGIDRHGTHFVIPVEVKSATDMVGYYQVRNMFDLCAERFPHLVPRPLGAQFIDDELIALFEFQRRPAGVEIDVVEERHYRLVPAEELPPEVIARHGQRPTE